MALTTSFSICACSSSVGATSLAHKIGVFTICSSKSRECGPQVAIHVRLPWLGRRNAANGHGPKTNVLRWERASCVNAMCENTSQICRASFNIGENVLSYFFDETLMLGIDQHFSQLPLQRMCRIYLPMPFWANSTVELRFSLFLILARAVTVWVVLVETMRFWIWFWSAVESSWSVMISVRNEDCFSEIPFEMTSMDFPAFLYSSIRSGRWNSKVIKGGLDFLANECANSFPMFPTPNIAISICGRCFRKKVVVTRWFWVF